MKDRVQFSVRAALFLMILLVLRRAAEARLTSAANLAVIVGGVVLMFPWVLLGRWVLDRRPTPGRTAWTTTFLHFGLGFLLALPIVRAVITGRELPGPALAVSAGIGVGMVWISGLVCLLTVVNLALKGLGAPFFIQLSRRLSTDWMYAWSRNPMAVAGLVFFLSVGIRAQSTFFVLWVLLLVTPAMLFFLKVFEERELEIRFGASYLEYKAKTPMLFPRKPRG